MIHLPPNSFLHSGTYRIVRFISSGGFGCTYEAEHVLLEKRVAIKEFFVKDFCNRDGATSQISVGTVSKKGLVEKLRRKFIDEAKALCRLHHPGIVSVSDVFEENGTAYYVMDYVDGKSLGEIVKQEGPLSEDRAVRYIRQVAEALQYVHENNRLHLDIKPGNIMIDGSDRPVLIDFGASKQYDEESGENTSSLLGRTPGYAPPEQMSNSVVKFLPATDIYALGATLYKVLTGVTPPDAFMRISGQADLDPLPSTISAPVREAVDAAMSIKLSDRPQTVSAFLQLLGSNDACGTDGEEEGEETVFDSDPKNADQQETPDQSKENSSPEGDGQGNKKKFPWWTLALAAGVVMVVVLLSVMRSSIFKKPIPEPIVVESISMDKESLSLQEGDSAILSVQYTPSDAADTTTEWRSTDEKVAQVDESGKVEAVGVGTAKIIASCNKKEAFCNVTVTARASATGDEMGEIVVEPVVVESISMNKESLSLEEGDSAMLSVQYTPLDATDTTTEWRSTNEKVAQVDKSGNVKAVGVGTAKIIASCNGKEAFCNVTVTARAVESISMDKKSLSLEEGESAMLSVQYTPSNAADKTTEWTSTNEKVAQVDKSGKVKAVGVGTAKIKASCNGKEAFCKVTVARAVESISMNKDSLSLEEGASVTLSVRYTPSDAADKTTEWRSTDEKVVQVDGSGKVKAVGAGTADIIASCNGKKAFCNLTVIPKIEMVYVPGGKFMIGATSEQGSVALDEESPEHVVQLSGYYIGKYEVTQALWESVMGWNWNPSKRQGPDLPVENVSWYEVQIFIDKLNAMTGKNYRLPTEAEWEYAARGGNNSQGYKYSGSNDVGTVAWYGGNSGDGTHPVGTKAANELGIHDMSGNVWEWCSDWYGDYIEGFQFNPKGPSKGSARVLRGGSWINTAGSCRVSYRFSGSPVFRIDPCGFRLAASSL